MKKIFTCLALLLCILLCGCSGYEKGKTFSNEFLELASLENMPLPISDDYSLNDNTQNNEYLKVKLNRADFNSYVESFVKYMIERNDIYYFGLQKSDGLIAEMLPHRVVYQVDDSFKCDDDYNWYAFSYSLSDDTSDYSSCEHVKYEEFICVTMEYDKEKGIAQIYIDLDPTFGDCIDESLLEDNDSSLKIKNLYESESWLASLDSSNVKEISMESGYVGVAIGTKTKIEFTNNVDEISKFVSELKNVTIELVEDGSWEIDGGAFKLITISLENGDKHSIYSENGFYQSEANHYRVSTLPTILGEKVTRVDFNYGTYNGIQVLMTDVYGDYDDVVWSETIENLIFTYDNSNRLYAFNNGIKYTLTEAYENELLTYENLKLINSSYNENII